MHTNVIINNAKSIICIINFKLFVILGSILDKISNVANNEKHNS